jgi:hypothetical protein
MDAHETNVTSVLSASAAVPTYSIDSFCDAENMSRSMLYKAWAEGWGPEFYLLGSQRRITHAARIEWQERRIKEAKSPEAQALRDSKSRQAQARAKARA